MRAFWLLCDWLENNVADGLYSLEELWKQMITISECEVVYSVRQMKNLLLERYGENICISEVCRRKNVLCFKNIASFILNERWCTERKEDFAEESYRIISAAA